MKNLAGGYPEWRDEDPRAFLAMLIATFTRTPYMRLFEPVAHLENLETRTVNKDRSSRQVCYSSFCA